MLFAQVVHLDTEAKQNPNPAIPERAPAVRQPAVCRVLGQRPQAIGGQRFGDVVSPAAYAQIGPAFVSGDRSQKTDNGIGDPVSAESGGLVYAIAAFCCLLLSVSEFFLTSVF